MPDPITAPSANPIVPPTVPPVVPAVPAVPDATPPITPAIPKEVKFEDLTPEVQKYIDQERTRASKTATEKALKDPKLIAIAKAQALAEANMTAEEKMAKMVADISLRENKLDAKDLLRTGGVAEDAIESILDMLVSDNKEQSIANTENFLKNFKSAVDSAVSTKLQTNLKNMPKPKTVALSDKAYKDMTYEERTELKKLDPVRFERELKASSTRI